MTNKMTNMDFQNGTLFRYEQDSEHCLIYVRNINVIVSAEIVGATTTMVEWEQIMPIRLKHPVSHSTAEEFAIMLHKLVAERTR